MKTVINKIFQIENAASSIMDEANARKKAFAQEMQDRTAAFDRETDLHTEQTIEALRVKMETEMNSKLAKQNSDAENILQQMQKDYQEHHKEYAAKLFQSLIEE